MASIASRNIWRDFRAVTSKSRLQYKRYIASKSPLAFAFDIDGVLLQGPSALPAGKRALEILEGRNASGLKIPYILVTNGGGHSEEKRCEKLTEQLGIKISTTQLVQAHTILRQMASQRPEAPVLVLGGVKDRVRKVAESYGFRNVYIPLDILAWNSDIWPFHTLTPEEQKFVKRADFSQIPISSILVFHDPRNWSLDIQIMIDILRSRTGSPGAPYCSPKDPNAHHAVELVFCNPDLLWRSTLEQPRLGQGAFLQAFQAVYKSVTGAYYPYTQYGKPHEATYRFAESMLIERVSVLEGRHAQEIELPPVYMVGDNPASDIAGANSASWSSILVHTGVYNSKHGPPEYAPTHEARDVEEAVRWALEREGVRI
ncbi:HAD-superfamily hydrolase [Ramaria rubella]|nr:HAD-superfamily hydrolase [Ramaria rubella]